MDIQALYQEKRQTPAEVAGHIRSGWSCCADIAAAIPPAILGAMAEEAEKGRLHDIRLNTLLDLQPFEALSRDAAKGITPVSWFSGKSIGMTTPLHLLKRGGAGMTGYGSPPSAGGTVRCRRFFGRCGYCGSGVVGSGVMSIDIH